MTKEFLFRCAVEAMHKAYSPYSEFTVGAALLCKNGNIYKGCNIENASYSATNCAERTAVFSAIANGEKEFEAICIVGEKNGQPSNPTMPCGVCRQVLAEFCDADFRIYTGTDEDNITEFTLSELLPCSFGKNNLGE